MNFDKVFDRVIGHEGRFQKHPGDRGNWTTGIVGKGELKGTKFGISAMTYPHLDIRNLTEAQARNIYHKDWWVKLKLKDYPFSLAYQMFDAAINHGMYATNGMLQRAVGVEDDGKIGPITLAAIGRLGPEDLLLRFLAERLDYFTNIGTFVEFGKGWCRRIAQNMRYAAEDTP